MMMITAMITSAGAGSRQTALMLFVGVGDLAVELDDMLPDVIRI